MSTPPKRKHGHERDATHGLKWIDTNKGSAEVPRYRSRLVRTEVRHKGAEPIFSATPPLEAPRVLLCVACQEDIFRVEDPLLISIADVARAHFYTDAVRDVHVRLSGGDPKAKEPDVCGKLRKTMYGSLDAAQRWRERHARFWRRDDFPEAWPVRALAPPVGQNRHRAPGRRFASLHGRNGTD